MIGERRPYFQAKCRGPEDTSPSHLLISEFLAKYCSADHVLKKNLGSSSIRKVLGTDILNKVLVEG